MASKSLRSDPCDVVGQDVAHHRAGVEGEEASHGDEIFAGHEETPVDPVHVWEKENWALCNFNF